MLLLPRCAAPSSTSSSTSSSFSSSFCCCSSCSTCSCCCRRWTSTKCITNWLLYSCAALQFSHSWPEPLILTMISQATHTHTHTNTHALLHTHTCTHADICMSLVVAVAVAVVALSSDCCLLLLLVLFRSLHSAVYSLQSSAVFYSLLQSLQSLAACRCPISSRSPSALDAAANDCQVWLCDTRLP